jgi:hypothetical protein
MLGPSKSRPDLEQRLAEHPLAFERLDEEQARAGDRVPERDWAGRSGEELSPLTLPVVGA